MYPCPLWALDWWINKYICIIIYNASLLTEWTLLFRGLSYEAVSTNELAYTGTASTLTRGLANENRSKVRSGGNIRGVRREQKLSCLWYERHHSNQGNQSSANTAFAVAFAFMFALCIKRPTLALVALHDIGILEDLLRKRFLHYVCAMNELIFISNAARISILTFRSTCKIW
jgi:hypothetical protein